MDDRYECVISGHFHWPQMLPEYAWHSHNCDFVSYNGHYMDIAWILHGHSMHGVSHSPSTHVMRIYVTQGIVQTLLNLPTSFEMEGLFAQPPRRIRAVMLATPGVCKSFDLYYHDHGVHRNHLAYFGFMDPLAPANQSLPTTWSTTQTTPIPSTDSTKIPPPNGGVDSMEPNQSSLMITGATCAPFPNYFDSWIVIPCKSKPKGEVLPSILH